MDTLLLTGTPTSTTKAERHIRVVTDALWLVYTATKHCTFKLLTILQSAALHPITQETVFVFLKL